MINRPSESEIGLFSKNEGKIIGLKMRNANIIGNQYVGGLVGTNSGNSYNLKNLDIQANVKGSYYVGGLVGQASTYTKISDFVFNGKVEATGNCAAGVFAASNNGNNTAFGVIYDSQIISPANTASGKVAISNYISATNNTVMVSSTTTKMPNNSSYGNGTTYTVNDMTIFDRVLDTIIGGDNDSDGYYFDYDSNGNITLYSTDRKPIRNRLKGEGTVDNPYIIMSVSDWNMISSTIDSTPKYYSLGKDLDFTGKTYYPIGTNVNKFNGILMGNHHTVSNVSVTGYDNVGLFGYNTGTIRDIKFNNITIKGLSDNVGIVANNSGILKGIEVRNTTVEGNQFVGGLVGSNSGGGSTDVRLKNIDVQANVKAAYYAGGLVGQASTYTKIYDFVFSGKVEATSNSAAGVFAASSNGNNTAFGVIYDSQIIGPSNTATAKVALSNYNSATNNTVMVSSTTTKTPNDGAYGNGTTYTTNDMMVFDRVLDTIIGGDNDSDGYYFDYDTNGKIKMYSIDENPINVNFAGNGTEAYPYVISTVSDWNKIGITQDGTPHYYK